MKNGQTRKMKKSFSPVAGIQWVETPFLYRKIKDESFVSVPLPGFSGLRLETLLKFS